MIDMYGWMDGCMSQSWHVSSFLDGLSTFGERFVAVIFLYHLCKFQSSLFDSCVVCCDRNVEATLIEFMRTKCRWGEAYFAEQPIRCFVATNSNTSSCNLNCPRAENRIRIKDYLECPSQSPLASMLYISRSRSHSPILS